MSFQAGVTAAGLVLGLVGGLTESAAKQRAFEATATASIAGENVRELQMKFESERRKRAVVREAVLARSMNLSAGVNQGASVKSSGVQGGMAGAVSQGRENEQTVTAAEILGTRIFRANKAFHLANANAQSVISAGQGLQSLGGALVDSASPLGKLFGFEA